MHGPRISTRAVEDDSRLPVVSYSYPQRMPPSIRVRRVAYRFASLLLRLIRPLVPIDWGGVKCVLTDRGSVLLVRHTYGHRAWDLPGGGRRRGELPADAARREMHEELGLTGLSWRPLGVLDAHVEGHRQTLHLYGAEVTAPELALDLGEIATARWFPLDALPAPTARMVRPIIDGARPLL
jgi:8-oxo-dGTP pyrophosphatase MutT (NUDIX family)